MNKFFFQFSNQFVQFFQLIIIFLFQLVFGYFSHPIGTHISMRRRKPNPQIRMVNGYPTFLSTPPQPLLCLIASPYLSLSPYILSLLLLLLLSFHISTFSTCPNHHCFALLLLGFISLEYCNLFWQLGDSEFSNLTLSRMKVCFFVR